MALAISQVRSLSAGPFILPEPRLVGDVAILCRAAVQAFSRSKPRVFTKPELTRWLADGYRPLVTITPRAPTVSSVPPSRRAVSDVDVDHLMRSTHKRLAEAVSGIEGADDLSFAYEAIREGWVERCQDTRHGRGFLPVARPGMRLIERLLSLLAVDCLVHPRMYDAMRYCRATGVIAFDEAPHAPVERHFSARSVTHLTAIR